MLTKGAFEFDDLHCWSEAVTDRGVVPIQLYVAITCFRLDPSAPPSRKTRRLNGLHVVPESSEGRGEAFLSFASRIELPLGHDEEVDVDAVGQQFFWRPPDADLVALAILDSLKGGWNGQCMVDLPDEMARGGIATWLHRFAQAAQIDAFFRSDGRRVIYEPYVAA